jgi:hypothetical protein
MKDSFTLALKKAVQVFHAKDHFEMSVRSRAKYDAEDSGFQLRFLGEDYFVSYPDAQSHHIADENREAEIELKILLLHYLIWSRKIPLSGELISFRDLPSSVAYHGAFLERAVYPVAETFASDSTGFKKVATSLGGNAIKHGDAAFSIPVLPQIPLVYVLWLGDDEIPSSANILFDSSASAHLPTEDLAGLGEITTSRLIPSNRQ